MLRPIAIWILAVLLGMLFVLVGFSKLAGPSGTVWAARLSHWGYPAVSRYAIGGIETLAGLGLLVPSIRRSAAITLIIMMTGAVVTHLMHAEFIRLLPPMILGGLAYVLYAWEPRNIRRRHVHGYRSMRDGTPPSQKPKLTATLRTCLLVRRQ